MMFYFMDGEGLSAYNIKTVRVKNSDGSVQRIM